LQGSQAALQTLWVFAAATSLPIASNIFNLSYLTAMKQSGAQLLDS
jgi:hypothetical protein